jgi:hypothetical protein
MAIQTETGENIVMENTAGLTGASSLNDTNVQEITKIDFSVDPLTTGWLIGDNWVWNGTNDNIEAV